MDCEKMIELLVDGDVNYILEDSSGSLLLKNILRDGFAGYKYWTDDELYAEIRLRKQVGEL